MVRHRNYIVSINVVLTVVVASCFVGASCLDLEELRLDENLKPMSKAPEDPGFYYDTVHGLTGSLHDADRGRGSRNTGCASVRWAGHNPDRTPSHNASNGD